MYRKVRRDFFRIWSAEMAYVLGFFAADGNMIRNRRGAHFVSFYSNDRRLLVDIRDVLDSSHRIGTKKRFPPHKIAYQLQIGSKEIFQDLASLGFTPNKSTLLRLPRIPMPLVKHFVRGYFDGDGNVYFKRHFAKDRGKYRWIFQSRFTSGSLVFLRDLHTVLRGGGILGGSLIKKKRGYDLLFSHHDSVALFHLMYNNIGDCVYLRRKYLLFRRAVDTLYGGVAQPGSERPLVTRKVAGSNPVAPA